MASSADSTPKASSPIPSSVMIDDLEPTAGERVGNWAAMLLALALASPAVVAFIVVRWFKRPTN
jgi:hypothetical protein